MELIGHRGLIDNTICENTLDSIKNALKHGLKIIEIDIQQTKDKVLVLHHDGGFIAGGKLYLIRNHKFKVLHKLKKIDTLNDAFRLCRGKVKIFLDIKVSGAEEDILRLIKKYKMEKGVVIDTFLPEVTVKFMQIAPNIERAAAFINAYWKGWVWWPFYTSIFPNRAMKYKAKYLDIPAIFATKDFIRECHLIGLKITPFHFRDFEQLRDAICSGADYVMIDTMEQLRFVQSLKNK